jgi:SpoVK/Ycf46/Vps4 family AAA+-type ATPase
MDKKKKTRKPASRLKKNQKDLLKELSLLINSRYGLIVVKSIEEERIESLMKYLADLLSLPLFIWTVTGGLSRSDLDNPIYNTSDPKAALDHIAFSRFPAIYYFQGLGPFLEDMVLMSKLAKVSRNFSQNEGALVMTGLDIHLSDEAKPHAAVLKPPAPNRNDYDDLLNHIYRDLKNRLSVKIDLSTREKNRLLNNLQGLTLMEAEKILTKAMIEDGILRPEDIQKVIEAKRSVIENEGLLEYFPVEESFADIADLVNLKSWLAKRKNIITDPQQAEKFGLPFPKGILLLGIPGSGKSLSAKAVAMEWGLPLLKMDPSNLYNKYIGESEKNFKRAMETAERMSPVVLWIDEIEKAFASGGTEDGGVSQRVLGIFLSWLQDRRGKVFVVATANDIARLPSELLRKGRFDEIFFVDLPNGETRKAIFRIHIKRREHDPDQFDHEVLADATEGFSGAEIEQVVVSALYTAFSDNTRIDTELLLAEARKTYPLSKTRREQVQNIRDWARERTVRAQ